MCWNPTPVFCQNRRHFIHRALFFYLFWYVLFSMKKMFFRKLNAALIGSSMYYLIFVSNIVMIVVNTKSVTFMILWQFPFLNDMQIRLTFSTTFAVFRGGLLIICTSEFWFQRICKTMCLVDFVLSRATMKF